MVIIIWEKDHLKVGNKKAIGASKLIVHKKDWLPTLRWYIANNGKERLD